MTDEEKSGAGIISKAASQNAKMVSDALTVHRGSDAVAPGTRLRCCRTGTHLAAPVDGQAVGFSDGAGQPGRR